MRFILIFIFTVFAAVTASAQISMKIILNQKAYLQYEPVYVKVAVRNMSGHVIAFGERPGLKGSLRFDIYPGTRNARRLTFHKPDTGNMTDEQKALVNILPDMQGVILPAGSVQEFTFRLSDYYDMRNLTSYNIKAVISHTQLAASYESNTVQCNVVTGSRIWGPVTVGIPDSNTAEHAEALAPGGKIKTRNYSIVSYFSGKVTAYALIIDDKDTNYMVKRIGFDLGPDLKPQCAIDFLSRLNVLVAASNKVFAYYQFNTDGVVERKQVYLTTNTRPKLVLDNKTGIVMPTGGRIASKDVDFEEIRDLPFTEDMFGIKRGADIVLDEDDYDKDTRLPAPPVAPVK